MWWGAWPGTNKLDLRWWIVWNKRKESLICLSAQAPNLYVNLYSIDFYLSLEWGLIVRITTFPLLSERRLLLITVKQQTFICPNHFMCLYFSCYSKNPWIKVGNVFEFETNSSMLSKEQNRKPGSMGPLCYNFPLWRATPQRGSSQKVKGLSISVVHLILCGSWDYDSLFNCQVSGCFFSLCKQENYKREARRGPWMIR